MNSSGNGSRQLQGLPAVSEVVVELETQDKPRGETSIAALKLEPRSTMNEAAVP